MIRYKIDIMKELKTIGVNTTKIRNEKIFGQGTLNNIKKGVVGVETLDKLCGLLECQPNMLIEYVPDDEGK